MLVLSRHRNEDIIIAGNIRIKVVDIVNGKVRLGIEAPPEVKIRRAELREFGSDERGDKRNDAA